MLINFARVNFHCKVKVSRLFLIFVHQSTNVCKSFFFPAVVNLPLEACSPVRSTQTSFGDGVGWGVVSICTGSQITFHFLEAASSRRSFSSPGKCDAGCNRTLRTRRLPSQTSKACGGSGGRPCSEAPADGQFFVSLFS